MPAANGRPGVPALERQAGRIDTLDVTMREGRNRCAEDRSKDSKPDEVNTDEPRLEDTRHEMADGHRENEEQDGETQATRKAAEGDEKH